MITLHYINWIPDTCLHRKIVGIRVSCSSSSSSSSSSLAASLVVDLVWIIATESTGPPLLYFTLAVGTSPRSLFGVSFSIERSIDGPEEGIDDECASGRDFILDTGVNVLGGNMPL